MALGADPGGLRRLVVGSGLALASIGVAVGLVGAWILSRMLESLLYGVAPTDPTVFATVAVLLLAVAALASYVPARRATRIDPVTALRVE
jgi:putative ABC transport system permease protein